MRVSFKLHTTNNMGAGIALFAIAIVLTGVTSSGFAKRSKDLGSLSGYARIVDADTIDLSGKRIRLEGIDAPEMAQRCPRRWFGTWACGKTATRHLRKLIAGKLVSCRKDGRGKHGRIIATCFVENENINRRMVVDGYAWAFVKYSRRYVGEESLAKKQGLGIWRAASWGRLAMPAWHHRALKWKVAAQTAPKGCAIKGNISRHGRIYHPPWSPWYNKVHISEAKGERWFCDEREAQQAGWRSVAANN